MSIWVSLYCRERVGRIEPADLVTAIHDRLDYFEHLYAQEDPEDVLARLSVEEISGTDESQSLHLHYLEAGPPIVVDRIGARDQVSAEIAEYLADGFQDRDGEAERAVRQHLEGTVETFHFDLKQRHADGMGAPLVYAAAAWLGKLAKELLRVDQQGWMKLDGGEWIILCQE